MKHNKIVVGISGSVIVDQGGIFPGYRRSYVNEDYVLSVIANGGVPFILPVTTDESIIESYIDNIDALILSGGHDIFPLNYSDQPLQKIGEVYPDRDNYDFKLLELAIRKDIPILGICRGFQIINVFHGGSLYQDLSYRDEETFKHNQGHSSDLVTHTIHIKKDSKLFLLLEDEKILVNSFHHQIVKEVGDDLEVSAQAEDGVVEAIEHKSYKFMLGVQWHPEMLHKKEKLMNNIFKELIDQAKM